MVPRSAFGREQRPEEDAVYAPPQPESTAAAPWIPPALTSELITGWHRTDSAVGYPWGLVLSSVGMGVVFLAFAPRFIEAGYIPPILGLLLLVWLLIVGVTVYLTISTRRIRRYELATGQLSESRWPDPQ
jgi:hypothetical protein